MVLRAFAGLLTVALGASAAFGQDFSLVGSWQTTHPAGPDGPGFVVTITYTDDGDYFSEMGIAPAPGAAGGIVQTRGEFHMIAPTTVEVTFGYSVMCAAGTPCSPAPPQLVPQPGLTQRFDFHFRGNGQIVASDGTVFVRVR